MLKITHTYLTNLKATGEAQNISCGEGLVLRVSPKGKKSWYLRYDTISAEGKRKQKEARVEADKRKTHAKSENTNIAKLKRVEKISRARVEKTPTFQELAKTGLN